MKARLATGEMIELKKDCECLDGIHTGPHFLHMAAIEKAKNDSHIPDLERLVDTAKTFIDALNVQVFANFIAEMECKRIDSMLKWMKENNIEEFIETVIVEH